MLTFICSYLQGEESRRMISPFTANLEHSTASVACLLSSLILFQSKSPDDDRISRVVNGLHSLHVYANEYWLDHLLAVGSVEPGFDHSSRLYALMSILSSELAKMENMNPKQRQDRDVATDDARIQCLKGLDGIYQTARATLHARSAKYLDSETLGEGI
jgi:hypothetical protein